MEFKFNIKGYEYLVKASQENLLKYLKENLPSIYNKDNVICTEDYVYCKGEIPVMLIAHLDTVQSEYPSVVVYDEKQGYIMSPNGGVGDDRNGIYAILSIVTKTDKKPYVLFTTDEEKGCVGAKQFVKDYKKNPPKLNFLVEFDRQGDDDVVFYNTTNKNFIKMMVSFGWKEKTGRSSDIKYISEEFGMAAGNVSVGYFNEHNKHEYTKVDSLMATIKKGYALCVSDEVSNYYCNDNRNKGQLDKYGAKVVK